MRTSDQISVEIEGKFGFFPPFFKPAQQTPQVLESLWQQALSTYLNNPLPALFKEKLSAYLSRYCAVPYCLICHSCSLYSLGVSAQEILNLLESPPPTKAAVDFHLFMLMDKTSGLLQVHRDFARVVPNALLGSEGVMPSDSAAETSLLYCSIFISLAPYQDNYYRTELRHLLGPTNYQNLVSFIGWVKTCHAWMEAHSEVSHKADKRAQDHLGALLEEEPGLADFFSHYHERVRHERQVWVEQAVEITERQRVEEALNRAFKEQQSIMEAVLDVVYVLDLDGNLIRWNKRLEAVTGLASEELRGRSALAFFPEAEKATIARAIQKVFEEGEAQVEAHLIGKDEVLLLHEWNGVRLTDDAGDIISMMGIGRDITERSQAEEALRQSEERYRTISEITSDFSYAVRATPNGQWLVEWVTEAFSRISGYTLADIQGADGWSNLMHPDDLPVVAQYYQALISGQSSTKELRIITKGGGVRWLRSYARPQWDEAQQQVVRMLGAAKDITQLKQAEEQLLHNAFHDALTGLPNRALFMKRLERALEHAKRDKDDLLAVLFLDLDRFKIINDSLGHAVGDQLLIATAGRLEACLRPMDTAARLGGDEFTVLLEDIKDIRDVIRVAERVQEQLKLPFALGGQEVFTTASIGIAVNSRAASEENDLNLETPVEHTAHSYNRPDDLLRDADIAMYRAKNLGRARYEVFDSSMHTDAVARLQLENDLRRAIEYQEFQIHYQPIVALATGRITGFEALVRWQHPRRGLLSPGEFILIAEETSLSIPIDHWVLYKACRQIHQWQEQLSARPDKGRDASLSINVNLCNKQFTQPSLLEVISQTLQETSLEASRLKLELTENVIMENEEGGSAILSQLKALGVQLAIDDFGTGHSSLARLHQLPIDVLKIDRSFVSSIGNDLGNLEFLRGIMALAHYLNVEVTAEGVETAEQLQQLRALNCKYGQGYFFAQPLAAAEAERLLNAQPCW